MRVREFQTVSDIPNSGALLGTSGSAQLVQAINESLGSASFFGSAQDAFSTVSNAFIQNIVQPIREIGQTVNNLANTLISNDEYRPLYELDDFHHIPLCMHLPIVMYQPVRDLLNNGRVSGFGYDPENLPDEDVYGRLIDNGTVYDITEACGNEDACDLTWTWRSDDPELSHEEIMILSETRERIDWILESTPWDPTNIGTERG